MSSNLFMFIVFAVVILGSAVMCVTTTRIMRAATFMLFVLFGVAGLYFLLDYTYLGAAQLAVYAGGVTMIFVFAIQLVNKQALQGLVERIKCSRAIGAVLLSVVSFAVVVTIFLKNDLINRSYLADDVEIPMSVIGQAMVGADKYEYVLPFEFISLFLLACIIGGLVISKKEEK